MSSYSQLQLWHLSLSGVPGSPCDLRTLKSSLQFFFFSDTKSADGKSNATMDICIFVGGLFVSTRPFRDFFSPCSEILKGLSFGLGLFHA